MNRDDLLRWMRRPLPAVPAGPPLCAHCGTNAAIATDGEPAACRECVMRLSHLAFFPSIFPTAVISAAWEGHKDVVELAQLPTEAHMIVSQSVVKICQHFAPGWRWTAAWPVAGGLELIAPAAADRALGEAYLVAKAAGL